MHLFAYIFSDDDGGNDKNDGSYGGGSDDDGGGEGSGDGGEGYLRDELEAAFAALPGSKVDRLSAHSNVFFGDETNKTNQICISKLRGAAVNRMVVTITEGLHRQIVLDAGKMGLETRIRPEVKEVCHFGRHAYFVKASAETSAEEWLRAGVEWPDLRPELYLQLLKQLTRTDGGRGTMGGVLDRGWQLLVAAFSHWPPPKVIENYVAYFVKVTSCE